MSFEYRMIVLPGTGASSDPKGTVTQADAIFSIDEYNVASDGNCLEATFRLLPKALTFSILPRDIVIIETRPNSSASFVPSYCGYVVLAGNTNSDNVQVYRLNGLKQLFYEKVLAQGLNTSVIASNDVGTMARDILVGALNQSLGIRGVTPLFVALPDTPALGFTLGRRIPQLESGGEALDALAASAPQFVVPTGQTYVYDTVTFNEGDVVPQVTWGVRANGDAFFRRNLPNVGSFAETSFNVNVEYPPLSGEEAVTSPVVVYYPGMDLSRVKPLELRNLTTFTATALDPVLQPLSYFKAIPNGSMRAFQLPNPSDYLFDDYDRYLTATGNFSSIDDAFDGNSGTSATGTVGQTISVNRLGVAPNDVPYVLSLDAEFGDTIGIQVIVRIRGVLGGQTRQYEIIWEPIAPVERQRLQVLFPVLWQVDALAFFETNSVFPLQVLQSIFAIAGPNGGGGTVNLYDFRPFVHAQLGFTSNTALADSLVDSFKIPVVEKVASIKVYAQEPLHTDILLTPEVGSVIEVPVERVQYSITTAEGVTTTYHAGQAFDGELVSERVVLEGLARRAVRGNT